MEAVKVVDGPEDGSSGDWKRWMRALLRALALIALLYFFICSLTLLEAAFRLLAGRSAGEVFQAELLHNPIVGLMTGILFTVLVQSSSTCTTVIVSLVASEVIMVKDAIPMVMGANIGTSMTSTLVSLSHVGEALQYERAFAAATVHDCFNWMAVIVLLIVEVTTGYLLKLSELIVGSQDGSGGKGTKLKIPNVLDMITDPFTDLIVRIDKSTLICWSQGSCQDDRLLKVYCSKAANLTDEDACGFLFNVPSMSDASIGGILLAVALVALTACLVLIVRVLRSTMEGTVAKVLRNFINADVPFLPFLTGYIAMVAGAIMTFVVQSSSVFTSTLTPLVGVGLVDVDRMYPLVLGSNIGTTSTALLAGFASGKKAPLQIALCHLFFNLSGIVLLYPIPFTRLPLVICKILGRTTARYRWFAVVYLFFMFFVLPISVLGLSFAGTIPLMVVLILLAVVLAAVAAVAVLQSKAPSCLPTAMRTWDFLPLPMHSLRPYDRGVMACLSVACFCCPKFVDGLKSDHHFADEEKFSGEPAEANGQVVASQPKGHANSTFNVKDETSQL